MKRARTNQQNWKRVSVGDAFGGGDVLTTEFTKATEGLVKALCSGGAGVFEAAVERRLPIYQHFESL